MLDIAQELTRWLEEGRDFAVATVVGVGGSAPRGPGAALAVDRDGAAIGSVSGGCVEGAVYDLCTQALDEGRSVVERFGCSDEDAFAVGLTCGGIIDVLVTPVTAEAPVRTVLLGARSPEPVLREWMDRPARFAVAKAGLAGALRQALDAAHGPQGPGYPLVLDAVEMLLEPNRAPGVIRADVRGEDVVWAVAGIWRIEVDGDCAPRPAVCWIWSWRVCVRELPGGSDVGPAGGHACEADRCPLPFE